MGKLTSSQKSCESKQMVATAGVKKQCLCKTQKTYPNLFMQNILLEVELCIHLFVFLLLNFFGQN